MNISYIRILIFILTFILVVMLPWWISILVLAGLTIYFPLYLEVLFFGFLFDALYSVKYNFPYTGLTIALVFLVIVLFIKTRIKNF
ncbi:MAG: hypothetical protein NTX96_02950 [Candidatus Zambryskibacteria bacterium]|nr:hypothetical protein [Candidatus Zambryskibacteria bacterium]